MKAETISLHEWIAVQRKMRFYNRTEGYVDKVEDKLEFFDSDPMLNGISAMHVTDQRVSEIIESYKG